jgi:hypothetical protein
LLPGRGLSAAVFDLVDRRRRPTARLFTASS